MAGKTRRIEVFGEGRKMLLKWKRSPSMPQKLVRRADYAECGIEGLQDQPKPVRPRTIGQDKIADIVATTMTPPEGVTHWSARRLAKQAGVGKSTVHRVW